MAGVPDLAAQLAQVQRQRQQLQQLMDLERQEAELTAAIQAQPLPHATPNVFGPLPTPAAPSVYQAPPAQPVLAQNTKPHVGSSIEKPIALDDTPPPSPRREVKREGAEPLALPDELSTYTQQESPPDAAIESEAAPKGGQRNRGQACADCRARRKRCKHKTMRVSDSKLSAETAEAATAKLRSKRKPKVAKTDHQSSKKLYGSVVEDVNYESIIKAVDSDDYVELACCICQGNCYLNHRKNLYFFRGAKGLAGHINICHASQKWEGFSTRSVAERCVRRTLSAEEVDAVLNGRHDVFMVDQVIARGADEDAYVKKERKKRKSGEMAGEVTDSVTPAVDEDQIDVAPRGAERRASTTRAGSRAGSVRPGEEPSLGVEDVVNQDRGHTAPGLDTVARASSMVTDNGRRARKTAPGGPLGHK